MIRHAPPDNETLMTAVLKQSMFKVWCPLPLKLAENQSLKLKRGKLKLVIERPKCFNLEEAQQLTQWLFPPHFCVLNP